jgi:protein-glutamine gamma-glutamyltransferase
LLPPQVGTEGVYISQYLNGGRGLLCVPTGVSELLSLPVGSVATNRLGSIRVKEGPGLVKFRAHYSERRTFEVGPVPADLYVPEGSDQTALQKALDELGLQVGEDPAMAVHRLEQFFASKFTYSTWLKIPDYKSKFDKSPLSRFLLEDRVGHCEYFATATVLLLRQLGIPARYATGFAVDEVAKDNKTFIVRQRHAHAWTLVWLGGAWRNLDTTPGSWFAAENDNKPAWEGLSDWFEGLKYAFAKFRYLKEERAWQKLLPYILVPMLLYVGWRVSRGLGRSRKRQLEAAAERRLWPGQDSEYFNLEAALATKSLDRAENESVADWRSRLRQELGAEFEQALLELRRLHLRLRFDPAGLSDDERAQLRDGSIQLTDSLLKKLAEKSSQPTASR